MIPALVMAGGRGTRMAASGVHTPKPLVEIAGIPLVEHNVRRLLRSGFRELFLSVADQDTEIRSFLESTLHACCAEHGAVIRELIEVDALGNIGATSLLPPQVSTVLVVYADNLTAIDLLEIADAHQHRGADLTLATHEEPFRLPFGRLAVAADDTSRAVFYDEKPTLEILVPSAVMVLGRRALELVPHDRSTGISDLANRMLDHGCRVDAWHHRAPWVDVNDAESIARAEDMVRTNPDEFALDSWISGCGR